VPSPRISAGERPAAARHTWTPLARRLGVIRTAQQRREILYAAEQIDWTTELDTCLGPLGGHAAQGEYGHPAAVRHLTDRVERANRAVRAEQ